MRQLSSRTVMFLQFGVLPAVLLAGLVAPAAADTIVVCAPGYPGSTAEAQPAMDGLAAAVAVAASMPSDRVSAVYHESEDAGVAAIRAGADLALVTLPFFLEHRSELSLSPVAQAVPNERSATEAWSLVAGSGAVSAPGDLAGWEVLSLAGHSPAFVRGPALSGWGEIPPTTQITFSPAVLSGLRRAARGEQVALLLDAHQAGALARLPFTADLEVVYTSPPLPVSLVCAVGEAAGSPEVETLVDALRRLDRQTEAAEALAGVRITRFVPVDLEALAKAEAAFTRATE